MDGLIVINKPKGWTSHDAVARVKKTLGVKKAGHLGTLDPLAEGVLPIVLDGATRFARFMEGGVKGYRAKIKLGEETDTYDAEGKVTLSKDPTGVTGEALASVLSGFVGPTLQTPPMYSSVKINGTPLYKLARKGVTIEREPKKITIHSITVEAFDNPFATITVECSRGTYIRTLCYDAGRLLGCGAHLVALERTRSGAFDATQSISPAQGKDALDSAVIPLYDALEAAYATARCLELTDDEAGDVRQGSELCLRRAFFPLIAAKEMVIFMHRSERLAVGFCAPEQEDEAVTFVVEKVFTRRIRPDGANLSVSSRGLAS